MGAMVRKQIYISEQQQALIQRLAEQRGVSQAEVIRQAIDREAARQSSDRVTPGEQAWEEAKAFMLSLRDTQGVRLEPYRWSREELYDDRGLPRQLQVSENGTGDDTDRY